MEAGLAATRTNLIGMPDWHGRLGTTTRPHSSRYVDSDP